MQASPNRNLLMALPSWNSQERRCGGGLGCYYNLTKKLEPCGSCGWSPTTADYRYAIVSITPVKACPVCFFEKWLSGEYQKYTCGWAPCRAMRAAVLGDQATMMAALFESHISGILPMFAPGLPQQPLPVADIGMTVPPGVAQAAGPPPPAAGPAAGPPPPPAAPKLEQPDDDDIAMAAQVAAEEAMHTDYLAELVKRLLVRIETQEGVQQAQAERIETQERVQREQAERIETQERVQREQAAEIQYLKRQTHQHLRIEHEV
jgi:hypothetical protein